MGFTPLDKALWISGFGGQLAVLSILIWRDRAKIFPVFTALMAFEMLQSLTDFAAYRSGNQTLYFWAYWVMATLDALLQLLLVYEMSKEVLRPTGSWVGQSRLIFLMGGLLGALLAVALSFAVEPKAPSTLFAWSIRLDLFTSLLIAELVVAMSFSAQRLGLQWRSWVMGLGQGLMIWVSVSLFVATAQGYWGWAKQGQYVALDHLRMFAFIAALGYWCVVFWREEPKRKPISPETMKYLYALHTDLAYDVARIQRRKK